MIAIVLFAALAVAGITGSIVAVVRDGYGPVMTRRFDDRIRPR